MRTLKKRAAVPYVLLIPLLITLGIFMVYPLYKVVENSFYSSSFLAVSHREYVGVENYGWLFSFKLFNPRYSYFVSVLARTITWVTGSVTIKVIFGLLGALILNNKRLVGKKIYRALVIVPWGIPWAFGAMTWAWTFNSQFGIVNSILLKLHIISNSVQFFSYPLSAFFTTMLVDVWAGAPFMIIMLLAGLQALPETLYEAAAIDGAGIITRFYKITLPLLKPVLFVTSLFSLVGTFNSFDIIWILTGGGPLRATETLPIAIYKISFLYTRLGGLGKASAMTVVQVILVTLTAVIYTRIMLAKGGEWR